MNQLEIKSYVIPVDSVDTINSNIYPSFNDNMTNKLVEEEIEKRKNQLEIIPKHNVSVIIGPCPHGFT